MEREQRAARARFGDFGADVLERLDDVGAADEMIGIGHERDAESAAAAFLQVCDGRCALYRACEAREVVDVWRWTGRIRTRADRQEEDVEPVFCRGRCG